MADRELKNRKDFNEATEPEIDQPILSSDPAPGQQLVDELMRR